MCASYIAVAFSLRRHPQSLFARPAAKEKPSRSPHETIAPQKDGIVKLKEESVPECANLAH